MITTLDKAIVGLLSSVVTILAAFGLDINISGEMIGSLGAVITGILVYLVPNKS